MKKSKFIFQCFEYLILENLEIHRRIHIGIHPRISLSELYNLFSSLQCTKLREIIKIRFVLHAPNFIPFK